MSQRYERATSKVAHAFYHLLSLALLACSGEQGSGSYEIPYFPSPTVSTNGLPAAPPSQPQTPQPQTSQPTPETAPTAGFPLSRVAISYNQSSAIVLSASTLYLCDSGFVLLSEFDSYSGFIAGSSAISAGFVRSTGEVGGNPLLIADFSVSDRPADKQPFEGRFTITMANGTPTRVLTSTTPGTIVDGVVKSVFDASADCIAEISGLSTFCQTYTGFEGAAAFCAEASQRGLL